VLPWRTVKPGAVCTLYRTAVGRTGSCRRLWGLARDRLADNSRALTEPFWMRSSRPRRCDLLLGKMEATTLLDPSKLWTRAEVLARPCPVPASAGVYAWFFDWCPQGIALEELVHSFGFALLYVGIAPGPPSASGKSSSQTLRSRLRYHFRGNAEGSSLRLSLGCLLSQSLGIELRRVGSGRRLTFGPGERTLDDWLGRSARIAWMVCDEPWKTEGYLIRTVTLPLNLDQNRHHLFHLELSRIRRAAKARARELPIC
jgi:hypothetical protein